MYVIIFFGDTSGLTRYHYNFYHLVKNYDRDIDILVLLFRVRCY